MVAVPTASGRTSVATAHLGDGGAATLRLRPRVDACRARSCPPCRALHVGSLGTLLEPGRDSVLDLVEQAVARELFVSYDANLRESFVDDRDRTRRDVRELGAQLHAGQAQRRGRRRCSTPAADPDDVARALLRGERTRLVLLTRGAGGATAFSADGRGRAPRPRPVEVVDTVGAGDAFMAAHAGAALRPRRLPAPRSGACRPARRR